MSQQSPSSTVRLARRLAAAGREVTVEETDGSLLLSGVVDTAEAREAAEEMPPASCTGPDLAAALEAAGLDRPAGLKSPRPAADTCSGARVRAENHKPSRLAV